MTTRFRRAALLLLVTAPLVLTACSRTQEIATAVDRTGAAAGASVAAAAPAPLPGPTTSIAPPDESGPADPTVGVDGLRPGQPVLVTTFGPNPPIGYVAWSDWVTPFEAYQVVPVTDGKGAQIAWWLQGAGWVEMSTVADPSFDARAYVAETIAAMASPDGVGNG